MSLRGKQCQCSSCKCYFTTLSNFDRHRQGKHPNRHCVDPNSIGLVSKEIRGMTFWHTYCSPENRQKFKERRLTNNEN